MTARTHQSGEVFLYLVVAICFCLLYAPQPLLSELADAFSVTKPKAGLLVSVTLIPMALAPLTYGIVLKQLSALTILKWALPSLALTMALAGQAPTYESLLILRLLQGALMPAILTATMAYLTAGRSGSELSKVMSIYIASTIVGGMAGRVLSGQMALWLDWSQVALVWALLLLAVTWTPWRRATPKPLNLTKPDRAGIFNALSSRGNALVYGSVACAFCLFSGFLNYLPFRMTEVDALASSGLIGLSYLGYSVGVVSALLAGYWVRVLGSPVRVCAVGFVIVLGSQALAFGGVTELFISVFVLCLGMFLIHTLAASEVNHNAKALGGVVNGLYVSCYYGGGVFGTWVMGYVYEFYGWTAFIGALLTVGLLGALLMALYARVRVAQPA